MDREDIGYAATVDILNKVREILGLGIGQLVTEEVKKLKAEVERLRERMATRVSWQDSIDAQCYKVLREEVSKMKKIGGLPGYLTLRGVGDTVNTLRGTIKAQQGEITELKAEVKKLKTTGHSKAIDERALIDYDDYEPEKDNCYLCELTQCQSPDATPAKWRHTAEREEDLPIEGDWGNRGRWICDDCYRKAFEIYNG